jgi:hypothetical protein
MKMPSARYVTYRPSAEMAGSLPDRPQVLREASMSGGSAIYPNGGYDGGEVVETMCCGVASPSDAGHQALDHDPTDRSHPPRDVRAHTDVSGKREVSVRRPRSLGILPWDTRGRG